MFELINTGGPMFMVPLTLLLLAVIGLIIAGFVKPDARRTALLLHVGVFAAVWGILGQTLGLISALDAIEAMGGVSPAMLAGGLKVSFVTTVTGLSVLTLALAGWTAIRYRSGG
ncbi:MAG: MotA/TolQ/ExbB proton channel family protein [Rhodothermales bacterium]|nr:MotA/TolQ/ExbB proton channel family protein [Rhodothermales bacterium]MBO6780057.1 MotA/TolQ/ExbB proton channel family protein [Rhodothermales bacterium]